MCTNPYVNADAVITWETLKCYAKCVIYHAPRVGACNNANVGRLLEWTPIKDVQGEFQIDMSNSINNLNWYRRHIWRSSRLLMCYVSRVRSPTTQIFGWQIVVLGYIFVHLDSMFENAATTQDLMLRTIILKKIYI